MSTKYAMKKATLFILAPAFASSLAMSGAMAQSGANAIEEVVVTGTRKEGLSPTETMSPIDVLGGELLGQQGSYNLTDSLTKIAPSLNTQRFPIADGTAFVRPVTLRNLSPDHTLVLVDGTRRHRSALVNLQLAPLGTTNQGSQAVDFSAFPSAAIKRVEVLRDGAAAQYGSDAIAGVVNLILNDADEGFNLSAQYGEYNEGDGERYTVSANGGFSLGGKGFVNTTYEYADSDLTDRGIAQGDAAVVAAAVGAGAVEYDGKGQRWGDPEIESHKLFVNFGYDLSDTTELYGHVSYMENETRSGFFYRNPVGVQNVGPRNTLYIPSDPDAEPVEYQISQAEAATVAEQNAIINAGGNLADYFVYDGGTWHKVNPIYSRFPGGYSPKFGADLTDYAFVGGIKGEIDSTMTWDFTARSAKNEVEYIIEDTINPGMGINSPTEFKPGTLSQEETSFNLDFVKTFDDLPMNFAFGAEWRRETYEIEAGDVNSYSAGPAASIYGVGSDGFQGFSPEMAGDWDSDSYGLYVDLEYDLSDDWSAAVAVRYEDYEEFTDNIDFKVSSRYQIDDIWAVRGTVSTGFRAPTPGQVNTLNVTTTSAPSGELIPSGTYPVAHPVPQALGAEDLDVEESISFTVGLVYEPLDNWLITLDFYNITIEDRLALVNFAVDSTETGERLDNYNTLVAALGASEAEQYDGSSGGYFANAFESEVTGIDLNIYTEFELGPGMASVDFRHNWNEQEISDVKAGTIGQGRVFDLENQIPEHSTVLTLNYMQGSFDGLVRINYYDDWKSSAGLFQDPDKPFETYSYSSEVLVDIEARYTFNETYTVSVGGDNIFDEYPDKEGNGVLQFLGQKYAVTSPFGFNGAFWYARVSASF